MRYGLQSRMLATNLSFLQNEGDANIYTIDTRLAHTLPVADIDAVSPAGDDTLSVSLGEVCYA